LSRSPTPFARDELEAPFASAPDDDRLENALQSNRARETGCCLGLEATARLPRVRVDRLDRQVNELGLARLAQQHLEATA
jgi:hypothetical protein